MTRTEKSSKSYTDLCRVDPQSGKLRLFLLVISVIIVWITLALISSLANPIGTNQIFGSNESQGGSSTLAGSLLDEILGSFFSLYTILYLLLFLLTIIVSFALIRAVASRVLLFDNPKPIGQYLKYSAFNHPACPAIDTQERDFYKSNKYKLVTTLGGPAYLTISSDELALVASKESGIEILTSDQDDPATFFLEHGTKLKCLLHRKERQTLIKVHTRLNDGRAVEFHGVRITYSLNTIDLDKDDKNTDILRNEIVSFTQNPDWELMVESLMQCELSSLVSGYSGVEVLNLMGQMSIAPAQDEEKEAEYHSDKTHNVRRHGRRYNSPITLPTLINGGKILRNRKRSIQPEMRSLDEPIDINETLEPESSTEEKITIETLTERLSKSVNGLFSKQVININIEEIGKVSFNEVH